MLSDFQVLVAKIVRDDSNTLSPDDIDAAIGLAVSRYSQDSPQYKVVDLSPNGTATLSPPNDWQADFSSISSLEYPIGSFPVEVIDTDQYALYQQPTSVVLRCAFVPTSAVRLTYSLAHVLTATVDTMPIKHREAISCWAAALCCDQLASYYANATDSIMQADHIQRGSQSRDYASQAKLLRARYIAELGINEKKFVAAGVVVDLDLRSSLGQDRFTHPNRRR